MIQNSINQMLGVAGIAGGYFRKLRIDRAKTDIERRSKLGSKQIEGATPGTIASPLGAAASTSKDLSDKYGILGSKVTGAKVDEETGDILPTIGKSEPSKLKQMFQPLEITTMAEDANERLMSKAIDAEKPYNEERLKRIQEKAAGKSGNNSPEEQASNIASNKSINAMGGASNQADRFANLINMIKSSNNLSGAHKQAAYMRNIRAEVNKIERGE